MVKLCFQGEEDSGLGCGWQGSPLEVKTGLMGKGEAGLVLWRQGTSALPVVGRGTFMFSSSFELFP